MDLSPRSIPPLRSHRPRRAANPNARGVTTQAHAVDSPHAASLLDALSPHATVRLPDHICWFILFGMLDIMLTWVIMHLGGTEVNPIANAAIGALGHWGLIVIKLASIITVVAVLQILAQRNNEHARQLATVAIAIAAFPPAYALIQLAALALARTELAALMLMPHP